MTHIMIDIETLGTRPGAAIVSMAAVAFDNASLLYGQELFWRIEVKESDGLHIEPATVAWWMTQSEEARAASFSGYQMSLRKALDHLGAFVRTHGEPLIWAHGASFDPVLLAEAAHRVGGAVPWSYKALRDTRTLFDLAGIHLGPEHQMAGHIAHHPLHDCRAQAVAVMAGLHRIRSAMLPTSTSTAEA